jgi:hypothetical protein
MKFCQVCLAVIRNKILISFVREMIKRNFINFLFYNDWQESYDSFCF